MIKLTEQEKKMYDVMGTIASNDVPVIYKGALVTKLILQENNFDDFVRETRDIDASWAGATPPSMEQLTIMLNRALIGLNLEAVAVREHGEKMSASYDIFDMLNSELTMTIDIDMRSAVESRTYQFNTMTFKGVTSDNVLSDKISAVSTDRIFRRAKDLIDIYALAHCVNVRTNNIHRIWERESRAIGDFNAFINRRDELRHSYDKLRRISAKPEFDVLYDYLTCFLSPFIKTKAAMLVWNNRESYWKV